ncbi:WD40 repeat domain-containing protein [Dactylosporangium sp. NPDC049742]|uniref:WD40 repeat domain-containing protein n=1 Tax=Dactylosporangium sp. NPDC049742 TaxID=3154737 RepID=UPI0034411D31
MPEPCEVTTRAEFAAALTGLRERAGLTVRQVAARAGAHRAHSTVGDWFAGRGLPSLSSQPLFVNALAACGATGPEEVDAWLEAWHRVRRAPAPRADAPPPYRGLASFQPQDAAWFFGRERLLEELVDRVDALRAAGGGVLVVVGASGAGKSSLLRAGLVAALQARDVEVDLTTPGAEPPDQLTGRLRDAAVLVVDQFEELFTGGLPEDECRRLIARLADPGCAATTVIGLRADFYAQALHHPPLLAAMRDHQFTVGPMNDDELRAAVLEPARLARIEVEPEFVELLLRDAAPHGGAREAGVLPLLSHALFATWKRADDTRLTCAGYLAVGGLHGAVAETATEIYHQLDERRQRLTRRLFLRLVHVGFDTADTRRRARMDDLRAEFAADEADLDDLLDRFISARLLTADADVVQISHEALLSAWPTLGAWLDDDRAGLLIGQQLAVAAASWRDEHGDPAALYTGARLAAARAWADDHPEEVSGTARHFLAAGIRHSRRRVRQGRQVIAALAVLTIFTLLLAAYGLDQSAKAGAGRRDAVHARNEALSRLVAGRADKLRSRDVALAMQLSLAAYRIAPTVEARSSLLDAFAGPAATRLAGFNDAVQTIALTPDRRLLAAGSVDGSVRLWHVGDDQRVQRPAGALPPSGDAVFASAVSPDGHLLATAGADRRVHLWRLTDPDHLTPAAAPLTGPGSTVYAVAFSPDGRTLAAGSADRQVWRWDMTDEAAPRALTTLTGPGGAVHAVAFSPDGRLLAAGAADDAVHIWDTGEPTRATPVVPPLTGHARKVYSVTFSPDGRTLASGSGDGTVRLWDVTDPRRPAPRGAPLTAAVSWVNAVAFSADGGTLAAGTSDKNIVLWNLASGRQIAVLPHPSPVTAVAFGGDGRTLYSSDADPMVRVWSLPGPVLTGALDSVFTVAYSPDGTRLAAASRDRTVALWDVRDPRHPAPLGPPLTSPAGHPDFSGTATIGPDGDLLAVGTRTGEVQLWSLRTPATPRLLSTLSGATDLVETIAFQPAGTLLATGGDDARVRVWDLTDPARPRLRSTLGSGNALVFSLAFQPGRPILAVASSDNTTRLWDLTDPDHPAALQELGGLHGYAYSVAFSPDGRTLAVGSADRTVHLWDMTDPHHVTAVGPVLTGPSSYVYAVAFSPDGRRLAAASTDNSVWLWDVTDRTAPSALATLNRSDSAVYTVAFGPDGRTLAAGGDSTRVWDPDPQRVAAWVCATAGAPVTPAEWQQYAPGAPYTPPCPDRTR